MRANRWKTFALETRVPFTTSSLSKFAKAADPWATGIAIFHSSSEGLFIWGLVDQTLHLSTSIVRETAGTYQQPGAFHAVINGPADLSVLNGESFIARLAQDTIIKEQNDCLSSGPVNELIQGWVRPIWRTVQDDFKQTDPDSKYVLEGEVGDHWVRTVSRLLISIQRQRHGGALLISRQPRLSDLVVKHSLSYDRLEEGLYLDLYYGVLLRRAWDRLDTARLSGKKAISSKLYTELKVLERQQNDSELMVTGAIRTVASFAGIDGAVVLTPQLSIRGFGAIIASKKELGTVKLAADAETKIARDQSTAHFGTRHRSMFRYCFAHPGSLGFVVSQDGEIRAITRIKDDCVVFDNVKVLAF